MADNNVVSIKGQPVVPPGQPNPDVVAMAEDILDRARGGDIQGLAVVLHYSDDSYGSRFSGTNTFGLVGCLHSLIYRLSG